MSDTAERLKSLDNSKLIDVVRNYRQYGYDEGLRTVAIDTLKSRGVSEEELKLTGNFTNQLFDLAQGIAISYSFNSKMAFVFYALILVTKITSLFVVWNSNLVWWAFLLIYLLNIIVFSVFIIKSFINQYDFYKAIGKDRGYGEAFVYFFVGMPLYIPFYFFCRKQMNEEMKMIN